MTQNQAKMKQVKANLLTKDMSAFKETKPNFSEYEVSFRRWLISQIDGGYIGLEEAKSRFNICSKSFKGIIRRWQELYSDELHLSLSLMSSKERSDHKKLEQRIKELEKQLEYAQMKNVAINTLVDIAEKELKISIRKKSGPKQ